MMNETARLSPPSGVVLAIRSVMRLRESKLACPSNASLCRRKSPPLLRAFQAIFSH
jgi:hypothetical protein